MINIDSTIHDAEIISAARAARLLGVKKETLYAYASRGVVRRVPLGKGRRSGYVRADVERLKARSDARAGHGAVASGALRWGEPVLDSAITRIDARGPSYRGMVAVDLARAGKTFEQVAELLWTGALPAETTAWSPLPVMRDARALAPLLAGATPIMRLALVTPVLGLTDPTRLVGSRDTELVRARRLIARLARGLTDARLAHGLAEDDTGATSIARAILEAAGARNTRPAREALDRALVIVADHELNASSFAARVAASAGADLYACFSAAIATVSGPRHGGECDRVEALVAEARTKAGARELVIARARRGEALPGFGHPLYPAGDPRAPPLLEAARALSEKRTETLFAIARAAQDVTGLAPTVDLGLVAIAGALGLGRGGAAGLFALGRTAGWVAHVQEQREAGFLLRPRARYVGA